MSMKLSSGGRKLRFDDGSVIRVVVKETREEGRMFRTVFDWDDVSRKVKRTPPPGSSSSQPVRGVGGAPEVPID
jgi:hypothetical protein